MLTPKDYKNIQIGDLLVSDYTVHYVCKVVSMESHLIRLKTIAITAGCVYPAAEHNWNYSMTTWKHFKCS